MRTLEIGNRTTVEARPGSGSIRAQPGGLLITHGGGTRAGNGEIITTTAPARRRADLALPFVLSVIAGSTDIIGFLGLNGLFTAHITGNLVVLAAHLVTRDPAVLSYTLAVPVFMLALLLTRLFVGALEHKGMRTLQPLLLLQFIALVGFLVLGVYGAARHPHSALGVCAGMFGVTAMAVQHALVPIALEGVPSTAVMTTNVTRLVLAIGQIIMAESDVVAAQARAQVIHLLPVIAGFALGCAVGAAGESAYGLRSLGLPAGLAVLALASVSPYPKP